MVEEVAQPALLDCEFLNSSFLLCHSSQVRVAEMGRIFQPKAKHPVQANMCGPD